MNDMNEQSVPENATHTNATTGGRGTMMAALIVGGLSLVLAVVLGITKAILLHGKLPILGVLILPAYACVLLLSVIGLTVGIVHMSLRSQYRRAALGGGLAAVLASAYTFYSVWTMVFFYYMMLNSFLQGLQGSLM